MRVKYLLTPDLRFNSYRLRTSFGSSVVNVWAWFTGAIIVVQIVNGALSHIVSMGIFTPPVICYLFQLWIVNGLIVGIIATVFIRFVYFPIAIWRYYRKDKSLYAEVEFSADEDGAVWTTKHSTASYPWSALRSYKHNSRLFLISANAAVAYGIPKKQLTFDEVQSIEDLLKRHLGSPR